MKITIITISFLITSLAIGYEVKTPYEGMTGISQAELDQVEEITRDQARIKLIRDLELIMKDIKPLTAGWLYQSNFEKRYVPNKRLTDAEFEALLNKFPKKSHPDKVEEQK